MRQREPITVALLRLRPQEPETLACDRCHAAHKSHTEKPERLGEPHLPISLRDR